MKQTSKDNDDPPEFVLRVECAQNVATIKADLGVIKNALIGSDLRGGLVNDVAELKINLANIAIEQNKLKTNTSAENSQKKELSTRVKIAIISLIGVIITAFAAFLIHFWPH